MVFSSAKLLISLCLQNVIQASVQAVQLHFVMLFFLTLWVMAELLINK